MKSRVTSGIACLLVALLLGPAVSRADSLFVIADPPVDFEVIDADDGSGEFFFDGIGDFGPFPTFNDAVLGSFGEARSMAEFDILPFVVPPGEYIGSATFQVKITSNWVFGLGVDGEIPNSVAVDGYVGNGIAELSDFQIGYGNTVDSIATPNPQVEDILTFDVTSFVIALVNANERYVGLSLRAETFGGLMFEEGNGFPKLTIQTVPEPGTLMLLTLAALGWVRRGR
jgi:hypothetical protein